MDAYTGLVYLRARWYGPAWGRFLSRDVWRGDYKQPLSLNAWLYTEANPVTFIDPTGFLTQSEAGQAETIVRSLKSKYRVMIIKDWGNWYDLPPIPNPSQPTSCYWLEGNWHSLRELELTRDAIELIASYQAFNGPFRFMTAMGAPIIERVSHSSPLCRKQGGTELACALPGVILLPDDLFAGSEDYVTYTIVHEFGHIWDFRTWGRLHRELQETVGTTSCTADGMGGWRCWFDITASSELPPGDPNNPYAGTSAWEDWAESFATYIYPDYYKRIKFMLLNQIREKFVKDQINAIR